jgi:hypothetical protein
VLRKLNSTSVATALKRLFGYKSDQTAIWNMVRGLLAQARVESPTSALDDVFTAKADELKDFQRSLQPLPDQTGLVVLANGEVEGLDIVSSPRAHRALFPELIKSYGLGSLLDEGRRGGRGGRAKVLSFFAASARSVESVYRAVSCGLDYRFEGGKIAGAALVAEGSVIHMNLYRN